MCSACLCLTSIYAVGLPSDALSGHRIRFEDSFNNLKSFYEICSNLQYFKKLIQIPDLPDVSLKVCF